MLHRLSAEHVKTLTGRQFFPELISGPFHHGLVIVFSVAAAMAVISALASSLRGRQSQATPAAPAGSVVSKKVRKA